MLPPKFAPLVPWQEVAVDLIGSWSMQLGGKEVMFNSLTCINPVTNLTEIIRIQNKASNHVAQAVANTWLARYPCPMRCVHDNGGEFTGAEFQRLLFTINIRNIPTTGKNSQINAVCERMHEVVVNLLQTMRHGPLPNLQYAEAIIDYVLAKAMHALRSTYNHRLWMLPGGLVYHRDMADMGNTYGAGYPTTLQERPRGQLRVNENLL